ncbi:hypothetical protein ppKF707_1964 [Metapseudomonas furukawaii]|uniref:Uncharacterized protein n=1 Tax=Metapseudomonas furukawaii TaxID=1149133 RepID=A0AAD1C6R6_METFU|nr:hypothetical protein ppKF707_1964 [Pseudomonas furukawaii]BAU76959.1 hypothetical protein KF707C_52710 [Pseudomonas furukawaii]
MEWGIRGNAGGACGKILTCRRRVPARFHAGFLPGPAQGLTVGTTEGRIAEATPTPRERGRSKKAPHVRGA